MVVNRREPDGITRIRVVGVGGGGCCAHADSARAMGRARPRGITRSRGDSVCTGGGTLAGVCAM